MAQVEQQRQSSPRQRRPSGPHGAALVDFNERQQARHARILAWRRAEAERRNVARHRVLSNAMAIELARQQPTSLQGLLRFGIGEKRLAHYGRELLQILRDGGRA
jgi:ribonuclease D